MSKKALIVANLVGFVGFLWNDIRILQSMGYEVSFAADGDISNDAARLAEFESAHVRYIPLSMSSKNPLTKQNITAYLRVKRLLQSEQFELVHCHTPIAGFIVRLAAKENRKKGTKVLYTTHGFSFTRYSSFKARFVYFNLEKIASNFCDTIITINDEDFISAQKMRCSDVRKINGVGVETERYHNVHVCSKEYKAYLGLPTDKIMILSVGELSVRKNHQVIIKALGQLPNKGDFIYVICGKELGNSGVTEHLKRLAEDCNVALYLLGHRSDVPQIMHCADIGAIPSIREGLGLAGIESLCAGVPLVGTRVQGIEEYILEGVTGCLCGPFDVAGYAEAIKKLSNHDYREELKRNCYSVARKFDLHISNQQMTNIYRSVLCEKGKNE